MKCPTCDGKGYTYVRTEPNHITGYGYKRICDKCKGTGYVEQTNEKWFCSLSTEDKADWLDKIAENCCQVCDEKNKALCRSNIAIGCKFESKEKWTAWLKEEHKDA